jgi:hypothetical protein
MMSLIIGLMLLCLPFDNDTRGLLIKEDLVILVIDHATTTAELDYFKEYLNKELNISLEYEVKLNKKDRLKWVKITVDCNDGFKGSFWADVKKKTTNIGFYRVYDTEVTTPFGVGYLPEIYDLRNKSSEN